MGSRFRNDRYQYHMMWTRAGAGRYWKRMLSKARRRAYKQYGIEGTPINKYESYCNYKGW